MNAPETLAQPPGAFAVPAIPIAQICRSLTNPRTHFDEAYLEELAESIKDDGVLQPITVRPVPLDRIFYFNQHERKSPDDEVPRYEIVMGECRWRAAKLAGLGEIPAYWRDIDDKTVLRLQVVENLKRRDLDALEEAAGYERMVREFGYTSQQIAAEIGKSESYVFTIRKLNDLGKAGREAFYAGQIATTTATLIARIPNEKLQKNAVDTIVARGMTHRDAKHYLQREFTIDLSAATFSLTDADLVAAAGSCGACPKRSGNCPDLVADIGANVCTDTKCFEEKRAARHVQLLDLARSKGRTVIQGEEAHQLMPYGRTYTGNLSEQGLVPLDDEIDDDAEGRTYRDVLGDAAPVDKVIECTVNGRGKELVEVATETALQAALKAAGFVPAEYPSPAAPPANETAEAKAKRVAREEQQREQERQYAEEREERKRRGCVTTDLANQVVEIIAKAETEAELVPTLRTLATVILFESIDYNDFEAAVELGFDIDSYQDFDEALAHLPAFVASVPLPALAATMVAATFNRIGSLDAEEPLLHAICPLLGIDTSRLPPPPAAHAQDRGAPQYATPAAPAEGNNGAAGKAKKPKAKTNPATPAASNEPTKPAGATYDPNAASVEKPWPQPNEHGVYNDKDAEAFQIKVKKLSIDVRLLQVAAEQWIWSLAVEHGTGSSSGPISATHCPGAPTRERALACIGEKVKDAIDNHMAGQNAGDVKKLRAWADNTFPAAETSNEDGDHQEQQFEVGDLVRVKDDAKGATGKKRKCCGREGTVEAIPGEHTTHYTVRFKPGPDGIVTNLTVDELEKVTRLAPWPFPTASTPAAKQAA